MAQLMPYHLTDTYSYEEIEAMDATGIRFKDGTTVVFQECARNFARNYPDSADRCVAECKSAAQPPYSEFYCYGKSVVVRFDNATGFRADARNLRDFRDLLALLTEGGFTASELE